MPRRPAALGTRRRTPVGLVRRPVVRRTVPLDLEIDEGSEDEAPHPWFEMTGRQPALWNRALRRALARTTKVSSG